MSRAASKKKDLSRYSNITFAPPDSVAKAAKRGLGLRKKFNRGGTPTRVSCAESLVKRKKLSPADIKRMRTYFVRHANDKEPGWSKPSDPSVKYINWMLWGGYAGKSWANKVVRQMESADKKAKARAKKSKSKSKRTTKKASVKKRLASVQTHMLLLARLDRALLDTDLLLAGKTR